MMGEFLKMSAMARNALVVEPESTGRRSIWLKSASSSVLFCFFCFSSSLAMLCRVDERIVDAGDGLQIDILVRVGHQPVPDHRRQEPPVMLRVTEKSSLPSQTAAR